MNIEFPIAVPLFFCRKNGIYNPVGDRIEAVDPWVQMTERDILAVLNGNLFFLQLAVNIVEI